MEQENKEKILIISMRAGFGHIRAGDALLDYAKTNLKNVHAEHTDFIDMSPIIKPFSRFYEFAIKKAPFVWGKIYNSADYNFAPFLALVMSFFDKISGNKIKKYFKLKNPDKILFTNVIAVPVSIFCKEIIGNKKIGIVVTDYHGNAFYNLKRIDRYFVANQKVKEDLVSNGVTTEKIIITGIPINPRFYIKQNVKELKEKYNIKNDLPIVLLLASFKTSNNKLISLVKQLLELEPKINLIVITNSNKNFYNRIDKAFLLKDRLFLVNWTNFMEEYMKISDVVISKAGGLTVSECLALKKPMVIINPVPGQEEYNAEFMEQNNLGKKVKNINEIIEILPKMLYNKKKNQEIWVPQDNPCEKIFSNF